MIKADWAIGAHISIPSVAELDYALSGLPHPSAIEGCLANADADRKTFMIIAIGDDVRVVVESPA